MRVHYFAYGSNLHPARLHDRLGKCERIGTGVLAGYRLAFHKRGRDGSGKCDIVATGTDNDTVFGAVYRLRTDQLAQLDGFEGEGYRRAPVGVDAEGVGSLSAFTYLAGADHIDSDLLPFGWYRELVLAGARYHGFPAVYIGAIAKVPVMDDPDEQRDRHHRRLLAGRHTGLP